MADEDERQPSDPFAQMVQFYDDWTKTWAGAASEMVSNKSFADSMAQQLESTLSTTQLMRRQMSEIMEQSLDHERFVTSRINGLFDLAFEEQDRPAQVMLQWFITEQVEEEENDNDIIDQLKLIKDNPQGLMMLDRELAQRAATVPLDFSKGVSASEG